MRGRHNALPGGIGTKRTYKTIVYIRTYGENARCIIIVGRRHLPIENIREKFTRRTMTAKRTSGLCVETRKVVTRTRPRIYTSCPNSAPETCKT